MKKRFVLKSAISTALALGPIYWFPSLSFLVMFIVRTAMISLVVLLSFRGKVRLRRDLVLASIMIVGACVLSSVIHSDYFFLSILPAVLILVLGSQVAAKIDFAGFKATVFSSVLLFSIFCGVILFDFASGGIITDPFYTAYPVHLHNSGFNGGRTAWGYASNLFLALALQDGLSRTARGSVARNIWLLPVAVILANVFVTGARGAFLVSIALIVFFLFLSSGKRKLFPIIALGVVAISVSLIIFRSESADEMRLVQTFFLAETRDLSTADSRMDTYAAAFDAIIAGPFFGVGSIVLDTGRELLQVHNVWLRLIAERGIIFFMILLLFLGVIWSYAIRSARRSGYELRLLIFSGILTGLIEPNAIFGNYFVSVVFWVPIGFFLNNSIYAVKERTIGRLEEYEKAAGIPR